MSWLSKLAPRRTLQSISVWVIVFSIATAGTAAAVRGLWTNGTLFHACVGTANGAVRLIAEGDTCKSSEESFVFPSQAYVDLETANRQVADAALSARIDGLGNIDAEAAARKQGDADTLSAAKAYTDASVLSEAAARSTSDTALLTALTAGDANTLNSAKTYTDGSVGAEAAARKQGDADTLGAAKSYTDTAVATEAAARQAADTTLQSNVNNETAARQAADAALQTALTAGDVNALNAAKSYTDGSAAAEAAARQAGDAATLAAANAYTDAHSGGASFTAGTGIAISGTTISADFAPFDARYDPRYFMRTDRLGLQILSQRANNTIQLDPGATFTASLACTGGKVVIGGGAAASNGNLVLYQSFPSSTIQWTASGRAEATIPAFGVGLTVYVICASL